MLSKQLGGNTKANFKKKHCSPKSSKNEYSCLNDKLILKIGKSLNKINKNRNQYSIINLNNSITDIHNEISGILKEMTGCSSEVCWSSFKELMNLIGDDDKYFKQSFKPIMPEKWLKDYNTWLRTDDIEKCLKQYEKSNKDFYFYGALPIDFDDCSVSNLCSVNLKKHINNGKNKIGMVFNTDPHDEPGEHWISFYIDILGKNLNGIPGIYYYDSYGEKEPKEVKDLIKKIKNQGKDINKDFMYFYNDHSHQKENYQCGMYCIHFIKRMIGGVNFEKLIDSKITDDKMLNKRKEYFISPKELKCKHNL